MARSMMLHLYLRCENGTGSNVLPMATSHATYIYNNMPNAEEIAPADIFAGTKFTCNKLKDIHMWGFQFYILDPKLQQGRNPPKFQPRSWCGIFVGFIINNPSDIPLILNPSTVHISTHFHVMFDDSFTTVLSISPEEEPNSFWNELDPDNFLW